MNQPRPLTDDERAALRERMRESEALLPLLSHWQAETRQPCPTCGGVIYAPVQRGYRCMQCSPALLMPKRLQQRIDDLAERPWKSPI